MTEAQHLVADSGGVAGETLALIRHHHERLGGQGYPNGLRAGPGGATLDRLGRRGSPRA